MTCDNDNHNIGCQGTGSLALIWEYGIRFNAMPTDVVLGREENADGSVTRTIWQADGLPMCEKIMRSPAPLSAIKGTKHIVRRLVGPAEVYNLT